MYMYMCVCVCMYVYIYIHIHNDITISLTPLGPLGGLAALHLPLWESSDCSEESSGPSHSRPWPPAASMLADAKRLKLFSRCTMFLQSINVHKQDAWITLCHNMSLVVLFRWSFMTHDICVSASTQIALHPTVSLLASTSKYRACSKDISSNISSKDSPCVLQKTKQAWWNNLHV